MLTVVGHTPDGPEIIRHDPSEGCRYRCLTCGNPLYGRGEVRGHRPSSARGTACSWTKRAGRTIRRWRVCTGGTG